VGFLAPRIVTSKRFLALVCLDIAIADDQDRGTRLDRFVHACFLVDRLQCQDGEDGPGLADPHNSIEGK
jgi:hypothetical protein